VSWRIKSDQTELNLSLVPTADHVIAMETLFRTVNQVRQETVPYRPGYST
ncbi:hypothetical protein R1flu_023767, partial [Riccia fluitans]